ncbi:pantoate--beta-alanine ligase [Proteiniclasticum sp. QWL-01]|uniref:pantoate--beta-alanine ligase n=1 Tax=Proteiniclasticum sp. QWL-01 TaxID=3036945 RepID=UPI002410C646|nr:pantoate--beta-alanine ligase [Proteiniclasticum sp. QWL-01]WFF73400.1 pantoate--beta-alanine ligase [Proteiniclasticum sp. QWL-01]
MLIKTIEEVRALVREWKKQGCSIGFVPTMGALHEGHLSLLKQAVAENDRVIASVFVNPTQFGPNEDYASYPRDIQTDYSLCQSAGVDAVFHPEPEELYLPNRATTVHVTGLTDVLCGAKRPGHFDGVCLVLSKLFSIVNPDRAYFGQKDAQQVAVVRRMVRDLNFGVDVIASPIVREAGGLARSSRNAYLSAEEKAAALVLNRSLSRALQAMQSGERSADLIRRQVADQIAAEPLARIDYVEVVDFEDLRPVQGPMTRPVLVAVAVFFGTTRLIDNVVFGPELEVR